MTTSVSGLIKIGKSGTQNYKERMRFLEANGYSNVSGLKKYFAIDLEDYSDKEILLQEIFAKHRVGSSELFALDEELVKQLLLSFEGDIVYPEEIIKEKEFESVSEERSESKLFSFYRKGLKDGDIINFIDDKSIKTTVTGEREVEFEGQVYKLSPLVRKIKNNNGSYQGAAYFKYKEIKLVDLPNVV
jgi:hypothetical protein